MLFWEVSAITFLNFDKVRIERSSKRNAFHTLLSQSLKAKAITELEKDRYHRVGHKKLALSRSDRAITELERQSYDKVEER